MRSRSIWDFLKTVQEVSLLRTIGLDAEVERVTVMLPTLISSRLIMLVRCIIRPSELSNR